MKNTERANMAAYYAQRADTFEEVYARPEFQDDLAILHARVRETLADHHVLELACGAGYWTAQLASSAAEVLATDINPQALALAQARGLPADKVSFAVADAFDLQVKGSYTACFAGLWWAHVKRQEQEEVLVMLRQKLGKDVLLVLIDNIYIEERSTSIARTDMEGNTYQIRTLPNGERHEVLKNYPTDSALRKKFAASVKDIRIMRVENYWMLTGRLK